MKERRKKRRKGKSIGTWMELFYFIFSVFIVNSTANLR